MHRTTGRSGAIPDAAAGTYVFDLIGPFRLKAPTGQDVTPLGRKTRGLLAYLALTKDMTAPRERLMALLWSERGEEQARASLRQCIHELRPLTGDDCPLLAIDRHLVTLAPARIETDLMRFEALVAGNDAAALAAGFDGFTRPLAEDLDDLDPAFDEWLAIERTRFEDRQVRQLSTVIQHALAAGAIEPARDLAQALAARHPTHEEAAGLAMTASHACGQRDAVRRIYQRLEAALKRDLGEMPSPETTRHLDRLMKGSAPAVGERLLPAFPPSVPAAAPFPRRKIGRRAQMSAVAVGMVVIGVGAAVFLARPWQPTADDIVLVRSLSVPPNDTPAEALRHGLGASLARVIASEDAAFHIADGSNPGDADTARRAPFVLEGEARTAGADVHATLNLRSAQSNEILWSGTFSGPTAVADALPQQAAVQIAGALTCALGTRHRSGTALTDDTVRLYFQACDAIAQIDPQRARTLAKQVVATAPGFSRAWSYLATASGYSAEELVGADADAMRQEARAQANRALELDPHNGDAYYALAEAFPLGLENWLERDKTLRAGLAIEPENADLNFSMAQNLAAVGRQHEALTFMRRSVALDPISSDKTVELVEALANDGWLYEARSTLERAARLWPQSQDILDARTYLAGRFGDPGGALAMAAERTPPPGSGQLHRLWERVMTALQSPTQENMDAAVATIMERANDPDELGRGYLVQQLAVLGRLDDAYALANRDPDAMPAPYDEWASFRKYMAPFRADPRFMPLAYRQGLVAIWVKTGKWPDFCVDKTVPYDCEAEARRLMAKDNRTENLSVDR